MRLLSFLTDIERALKADEPSPRGADWENSRSINYHQGMARLTLACRTGGQVQPLGAVFLQAFRLADGSTCLKSYLTWQQGGLEIVHAIYEKPELDWSREARTVAASWLNGMATEEVVVEAPERLAVAS